MKTTYSMRELVNAIVWMEEGACLRAQFLTERNRRSVECRFAGYVSTVLGISQLAQAWVPFYAGR